MAEQNKLTPLDENWERALAVVAHPDDLEYGAASAVARWTSQGKDIGYLLATRGEAGIGTMPPAEVGPLREQEERTSAGLVGVQDVEFLGYTDGVIEYGYFRNCSMKDYSPGMESKKYWLADRLILPMPWM
jgi:LmbE family N-acetylglucosaminyl deacetylase